MNKALIFWNSVDSLKFNRYNIYGVSVWAFVTKISVNKVVNIILLQKRFMPTDLKPRKNLGVYNFCSHELRQSLTSEKPMNNSSLYWEIAAASLNNVHPENKNDHYDYLKIWLFLTLTLTLTITICTEPGFVYTFSPHTHFLNLHSTPFPMLFHHLISIHETYFHWYSLDFLIFLKKDFPVLTATGLPMARNLMYI